MLCAGFRMPKPWEESHLHRIDERWARSIRTLIAQGCVWEIQEQRGGMSRVFQDLSRNGSQYFPVLPTEKAALLRARLATNTHLYFVIWAMRLVEGQTSENQMIDLEGFIQNFLRKRISWICLKEKKKKSEALSCVSCMNKSIVLHQLSNDVICWMHPDLHNRRLLLHRYRILRDSFWYIWHYHPRSDLFVTPFIPWKECRAE